MSAERIAEVYALARSLAAVVCEVPDDEAHLPPRVRDQHQDTRRGQHQGRRATRPAALGIILLEIRSDAGWHPHGAARGKRHYHGHAHADVPHGHILREVCTRPECCGYPTHDVHRGPK